MPVLCIHDCSHKARVNSDPEASENDGQGGVCSCMAQFKVAGAPATVYYVPNFVSHAEAELLMTEVLKKSVRDASVSMKALLPAFLRGLFPVTKFCEWLHLLYHSCYSSCLWQRLMASKAH